MVTTFSALSQASNVRLSARSVIADLRIIDPQRFHLEPLVAGTLGGDVNVNTDTLQQLLRTAAADIAEPGPSDSGMVLWRWAGSRLLVGASRLQCRVAAGVIAISLPVACDEIGAPGKPGNALVHVSFFVGSPDRPAGLLATTEERPRGPAAVVDLWGERLIALAWQTLMTVLQALAAESGRDEDGAPLLPASLVARADGITLHPQARHPFDRVKGV